jgi:hypothetical protein
MIPLPRDPLAAVVLDCVRRAVPVLPDHADTLARLRLGHYVVASPPRLTTRGREALAHLHLHPAREIVWHATVRPLSPRVRSVLERLLQGPLDPTTLDQSGPALGMASRYGYVRRDDAGCWQITHAGAVRLREPRRVPRVRHRIRYVTLESA